MAIEKQPKASYISKVRVEEQRRDRYERAFLAHKRRVGRVDMSFTDWVRLALDRQASKDLE